jgi:hypothetical protein
VRHEHLHGRGAELSASTAAGQQTIAVDVLLSLAAALISLRLAGPLLRSHHYAWAGGVLSLAAATATMAWGTAHGWDDRSFRVWYLAGALLSAPLLGVGSLSLWGRRWAAPVGLLYTGLAVGIAAVMPVHGTFASTSVPHAQDHVDALPRIVAIVGSSLGTIAVGVVAVATMKQRRLGNWLLLGAVAAAGAASALTQTAVGAAAACFALAAVLLYASANLPVGSPRVDSRAAAPTNVSR